MDLAQVPASQQAAFTTAEMRWESIITGDVADISSVPVPDECGGASIPVDDLFICAQIVPIDGEFGILGQAGPNFVRTLGGLFTGQVTTGLMQFDIADIANLQAAGEYESVILHEMGTFFTATNYLCSSLLTCCYGFSARYWHWDDVGVCWPANYRSGPQL